MIRVVSPNCLKCPTFRAGKCAGSIKRAVATEALPITRKGKQEGDISSVFSTFSGRKSSPLPERFRELKRNLTTGFEEQIQKSWDELVETLKVRTEEVASKRESVGCYVILIDMQVVTDEIDYSPTEILRHPSQNRTRGEHRRYSSNGSCGY